MARRVLRGKLQTFDGTYTETQEFLMSAQEYLMTNSVSDEAQKVNITLNHIRGERVSSWVASKSRWLDEVSADPALLQGQDIWDAFEDDFLREFADPAERAKARKEIEEIKMEGEKLRAYVQDFCALARKALYDLDAPYVLHLFLQGLPAGLVRCCVDRDKLKTFEECVNAVHRSQVKYRYILHVLTAPPLSSEEALVLKRAEEMAAGGPSTTGVNRRQSALTEQDKNRYRREGRCFRCSQQGHFAKMCPRARKKEAASRPTRNETQSSLTSSEMASLKIRAYSAEERRAYVERIQDDQRECWNYELTSRATSPVRTGVIVVDDDNSIPSPAPPMTTGVMIVDDDDEAFRFCNRDPSPRPPSPVWTGVAIVE